VKKTSTPTTKTTAGSDLLASARDAYAKGDLVRALEAATLRWRETRAAVIADAVDALSTPVARTFAAPPPEETRTNADFQARWMATLASNDPASVTWLAENLFAKLPGRDMDGKQDAFTLRLRALRKAPPDPRMAAALVTLLDQAAPIVTWSSDACRKTLLVIGDERSVAALGGVIEKSDKRDVRSWKAAREKLGAMVQKLDEAEHAGWSALGPRPTSKATGDRAALFEAVLASPGDDQAREVLADCLLEQGDPRGELISIQLAEARGTATHEASKRADALLKQHKKAWLGPLARVTYRAYFRKGFLDELELDGSWKVAKKAWPDLAKDPLLATVRFIHGKPTPDIIAHFLGSPALRALETADIYADPLADAIERTLPATLREIRCTTWKRVDHKKKFIERVLPLIEAIPSVDTVSLTDDVLKELMASKAWKRIRTLKVPEGDKKAITVWSMLPEHVTSFQWGWSSTSELRRAPSGELSLHVQIINEWFRDELSEVVRGAKALDKLTRIEVIAPKKHMPTDKTFASIKRRGLTIDVREPTFRSGLAAGIGA